MLKFRAYNLNSDKNNEAWSKGCGVTINFVNTTNLNFTLNGETVTSSSSNFSWNSNALPVIPGCEIMVLFEPSQPEETEALFTMPDGTVVKATAAEPSFRWIVPDNIATGMQIIGISHFETKDFICNYTGSITIIRLETEEE